MDFNLIPERNAVQNVQQETSNLSLIPVPHFQRRAVVHCEIHAAHKFYCQTCSQSYCGECGVYHNGHVTINVAEAMESATAEVNRIMNEARGGINTMRQDLNSCQVCTIYNKTYTY